MSALWLASTVILTGVVVCGVAKAQSTPDPSASDKMAYWSAQRRGANHGPVRLGPADLQAAANAGIDFEPARAFAARYDVPKHRIIVSEFWCDRRVNGAALYLADEMPIYNELGWHWAFYGFRGEGAWTGLDYEIPLDARIAHLWDAEKRGEDLEPLKPRRDNPVWAVIQRELIAGSPTATAPVFTDVFRSGAEGYASIRIPAVLVTKTGTVLAFAEGRRRPADQAENDIVMKRSTGSGKNWSSLRVLHDDGAHSLNNPTVVQEQVSGRIFVWYQRIPSHLRERSQSTATGLEGPDIYRNFILTSDDDGATWSTPQDMTVTTKRPERATTIASGPGMGIQLTRGPHQGRLIIPFNEGPYGVWQNYAVFSDDAGKTWRFGADVPGALIPDGKGGHRSRINEAQVAELSDGSVRLDSRQFAGATVRKTAVSRDGGATWSPPPSSRSSPTRAAWPACYATPSMTPWAAGACCTRVQTARSGSAAPCG
jgi:BNR repeat-like domain